MKLKSAYQEKKIELQVSCILFSIKSSTVMRVNSGKGTTSSELGM